MRKHTSQYLAGLEAGAAELLADRLAQLRVLIAQKRAAAKRKGIIAETPALRMRHWEKLAADYDPHEEIRKKIEDMLAADENTRDELMLILGEEFLESAERGNEGALLIFIEEGFPVTWQDPESGLSALHIVAACQARNALRVLLYSGQCDFLLRDKQGRLPSEMAYLYGEDVAVARLLGNRERKQAEMQGVKLTRRSKPE